MVFFARIIQVVSSITNPSYANSFLKRLIPSYHNSGLQKESSSFLDVRIISFGDTFAFKKCCTLRYGRIVLDRGAASKKKDGYCWLDSALNTHCRGLKYYLSLKNRREKGAQDSVIAYLAWISDKIKNIIWTSYRCYSISLSHQRSLGHQRGLSNKRNLSNKVNLGYQKRCYLGTSYTLNWKTGSCISAHDSRKTNCCWSATNSRKISGSVSTYGSRETHCCWSSINRWKIGDSVSTYGSLKAYCCRSSTNSKKISSGRSSYGRIEAYRRRSAYDHVKIGDRWGS